MQELKGMIGLEIHVYLITKEKLFCHCEASRKKGLKQNINVCPICSGQPGAKPLAPNYEAVKKAILIGLMLGCKINLEYNWQRKHYDWPDLPKGYQNTLSGSGAIPIGENGEFNRIGIWSMHLEEDPASWDPLSGCVDYNRSGLPLVEIVTAPDFKSAEEVSNWLKLLIHNLAYLKSVDKDAGIKVDVNVNIQDKTERVEIKNLNSIESIEEAILYELERQAQEGSVRETRRYDPLKKKTIRMRSKEEEEDYRFISDPDLQNISLDTEVIALLQKSLPENPQKKLERIIKQFKISKYGASVLTKHIDIAEFFEKLIEKGADVNFTLPWITVELLRFLNYNKTTLDKVEIKTEHFIELLNLIKDGKITALQGKQILNKFYPKSFSPKNIEEKITDKKQLEKITRSILQENKKALINYKAGEKNAFNFLMGQIMRKTNKRADFAITRKILEELLNS